MNLYIVDDNHSIDEESLELMYIFVESCKVFEGTGFCLHPQYDIQIINKCDDVLKIQVREKKNFVDLFKKEKVNVKVICGKNGSGKSTLLSLLEKSNHRQCIYLFKDKKNQFASNRKMIIQNRLNKNSENISLNYLSPYYDIRLHYVCPTHRNMQVFPFKKNIVDFYIEKPNLFENILSKKDRIITNYTIELEEDAVGEISSIASDFLNDAEIESIKKNPVVFYIIACLCDSSCQVFVDYLKQMGKNFLDSLRKICENKKNKILYNKIKTETKALFAKEYAVSDYNSYKSKITHLSQLFCILLKQMVGEHISILYDFRHYVYLNGYAYINGNKRYISQLSDGEYIKLKYSYELIHSIAQPERMFLLYDEPEKGLHPEWCRRFFSDFFSVYKKVIKYNSKHVENFNPRKRMSFFFATHSPFLLSDVTNDYVIYLEKNSQGFTTEVKKKKNIFAGNIGEMFLSNFFMNRTIGAFATKKVKEIFKKLNCENNRVSKEEINILKNNIGDDLLKHLLLTKWNIKNAEN